MVLEKRYYKRFEIPGKLVRGVPVLFSREIENCINVILKYHEDAGVRLEISFIFGMPKENYDIFHFKATANLGRDSVACGSKHPVTLKGAIVRKHVNMCQITH